MKNLNVAVREWQDEVVFLHKIVDGAADKSYGIHVARLAGVPREVLERAKEILASLEQDHLDADGRAKLSPATPPAAPGDLQLTLFEAARAPALDQIRAIDLNNTTPMKALELLERWKAELGAKRPGDGKMFIWLRAAP